MREVELNQRTEVMDQLCQSLRWRVTAGFRFQTVAHINIQETKALTREIIRLAALDLPPRRFIVFLESAVCVWAYSKGRSSSFRLNHVLRGLARHLVLGLM